MPSRVRGRLGHPAALGALLVSALILPGCCATVQSREPWPVPQTAESLLRWSPASNGLKARIEGVWLSSCSVILVRLSNVGTVPVVVPTSRPAEGAGPDPFQLYYTVDGRRWERLQWVPEEPGVWWDVRGLSGPRPPVTLRPRQSALAFVCGHAPMHWNQMSAVRVALHVEQSARQRAWTGRLETPAWPVHISEQSYEAMARTLPLPDHLPAMKSPQGVAGLQMIRSGESMFSYLRVANGELTAHLHLCLAAEVAAALDQRMAAESDENMKVFHATIAASAGSAVGRDFLLKCRERTDLAFMRSVLDALGYLTEIDPPGWVIDSIIAALADDREVVAEPPDPFQDERLPLSYLADEDADLCYALGDMKCRKAVPALIEMVHKTDARRGPVTALGRIGDRRAVAVLLEYLKKHAATAEYTDDYGLSETFQRLVDAMGDLKPREAVPVLMEYMGYPDVIRALGRIGDPRPVPVLREMVATGGGPAGLPAQTGPVITKQRFDQAKIALAALEEGDPIPRYCALLSDMSLDRYASREIVWALGDAPDARAIPYLVERIKRDPTGTVVNQAITVLGAYRHKAAVTGLIECFDADFDGKQDWKRALTPEMFRDNIAESLRQITGVSIGTSKGAWQRWWKAEGAKRTDLR